MNETYVECLVKQKTSVGGKFLKVLLIVLTVFFAIAMMIFPLLFLFALAAGFGAYYVHLRTDLEYEYLFLERELAVDKVMAKTRRKRMCIYNIDRIEIMAPIHSHRLDNYKNRQVKVKDYSIGEELKPDRRYAMYYEGGEKIILSPSEELLKAMKSIAPRKIFTD